MRASTIYDGESTAPRLVPAPEPAGDLQPPRNIDAERMVVSACLLDDGGAEALDDVMLIVRPSDFYREAYALMFGAMCDLRSAGGPTDATTLIDELERRGHLGRCGGEDGVAEACGAAPHSANARFHASIVRQKSQTRRLIQACTEIIRDGYSNLYTSAQLVEAAEARVFAIRDEGLGASTAPMSEVLGEVMAEIERRRLGGSQGLPTGFRDVDQFVTMNPGDLIIVAARPSIGKTAFAAALAGHAAERESIRVLFVSLEMTRQSLVERMLSSKSGIAGGVLRTPWTMGKADEAALFNTAHAVDALPFDFTLSPRSTVSEIAAQARRMKHRGGLGLVVVDYLGLVEPRPGKTATRQDDVAGISRDLKAAALELKVPFVVLCQLNRQSESRDDRRPRLSDLRESGQIEQDADAVLLLHRPEFYDPNDRPGIAEVVVAKNRNGATGAANVRFLKHCTRFEDAPPEFYGAPATATEGVF